LNQRKNKGVSTVFGSILFMILVITLASILFVTLYRYNEAAQASIQLEEKRTQEKMILLSLTTDSQSENLKAVLVSNNGSITTRIRAVYINSEFRGDPSNHTINPSDTYINAKNSSWIQLPDGIKYEPTSTISLASERGIKTIEYQINLVNKSQNQPPPEIPRSNFGPLQLDYNKFYYAQSDPDGNRLSDWKPGWNVTEGSGRSIMWNITLTNVDDRSILLNQYSCFTLVPNALGSASQTPWYIEPTGGSNTMVIAPNETGSIVYIWGVSRTLQNARPQTTPNQPFCKVILTLYGSFLEHDGSTKPYGQTIPFQAVIINGAKGGENYFTTTILDPISTPLLALQTGATFSGTVNATVKVPTGANRGNVTLQYSTTGVSPWTNITSASAGTGTGIFSGTFTAPSPGTYYFRAYFEGAAKLNDIWAPSVSTLQTIIVNQRSSSTSLSLSLSTINFGQSITATANVNQSIATGIVTFEVSTDSGSTFTQLGTPKSLSSGSAVSDPYTPSAPGNGYRFRAFYSGDINVAGSTSSVVSLTVNKANPTISVPTLNPGSQINLGDSVTASVNINGVLGVIPTGTVTFQFSTDGGLTWNTLGATKTLVSGSATSDPYTPPTVSNQYRFRALYSGDSNYNNGNSNPASLTVKTNPTISAPTLSPASPITYGTSLTARVTLSGSAGTPTGNIDFYVSTDGGATFTKFGATKSLISGSATSDPYTPPSTGSNYQFRAVYLGDISYNSVQSSATPLTVNQAPSTTSITLSSSSVPLGSSVTAIATVAPAAATGTMIFEVSTDNGVTFSQFGSIKSLSSGSATSDAYTPPTPGNNYWFRATYSGDSNLFGSTSSSVNLTVYGPLDHFVFSTIGNQTAGTPFNITVMAKDLYGNTVANYTGSNSLVASNGTIIPTSTGAFANGVRMLSVNLTSAGSGIFITTSGGGASGQSNSFTVNPSALSSFRFAAISSPQTAGTPFNITITAQDAYGNTITNYTGTNNLTVSNGTISPTSTGAFANGTWTGTVNLTKAVTNVTLGTTGGVPIQSGTSGNFSVVAGSLDHFAFDPIGSQITDTPFNITIRAMDAYNNTVTSYSGNNSLSDLSSSITPTNTTSFTNGVWKSTVTITSTYSADAITTIGGGKSGTSNTFEVEIASTSLTVSCNPTTVNQNGSSFTTVSGNLMNLSGVPDKTINLYYQAGASGPDVPPSGGTWVFIASVTTAADGTFTYQWNPDDMLADGYYWIKAEFAGDANYAASEATTGTGGVINLQLYAT
jgi:hypothetical protein